MSCPELLRARVSKTSGSQSPLISYSQQALDSELSATNQSISSLQLEKTTLDQERAALARQRTNADLFIKDLEERGEETGERKRALESELERLEATIAEKETELMEMRPQWEDKLQELDRERSA